MRNHTTRAETAAPAVPVSADSSEFHEPLPRLTKKVFTDLAIWMTGLGLFMGIVFPFFVMLLGVPSGYVLTAEFFVATIGAGLVVGVTNQFLSRAVVGSRLRFMRSKMAKVEGTLRNATVADDEAACTPDKCKITVDSDDELGDAAASFNRLVEALAESQQATRVGSKFADHAGVAHRADTARRRSAQCAPRRRRLLGFRTLHLAGRRACHHCILGHGGARPTRGQRTGAAVV